MRRDLIRLTFKQFRFEALAIGASLLALATVLIIVAIRLQAIDIAACSGPEQALDCGTRRVDVDGLFSFVFVGQPAPMHPIGRFRASPIAGSARPHAETTPDAHERVHTVLTSTPGRLTLG